MVAPDVIGHHHGHAGYRAVWREVLEAFEDWTLEPEELIDLGNRLIGVTRMSGHGAVSGVPVSQSVFSVYTFRRGLVLKQEDFGGCEEAPKPPGCGSRRPLSRLAPAVSTSKGVCASPDRNPPDLRQRPAPLGEAGRLIGTCRTHGNAAPFLHRAIRQRPAPPTSAGRLIGTCRTPGSRGTSATPRALRRARRRGTAWARYPRSGASAWPKASPASSRRGSGRDRARCGALERLRGTACRPAPGRVELQPVRRLGGWRPGHRPVHARHCPGLRAA